MSEILTKHPESVFEVLESQGATCGSGVKPVTLTSCPPENLCILDGGELCVFRSDELGKMTQLAPRDVCTTASAEGHVVIEPPAPHEVSPGGAHVLGGAALAVVVVAGIWMAGRR
jgi:hypothetical protein